MMTSADYGPAIAGLLGPPAKMPLGAGQPNEARRARLDVPTETLFDGHRITDESMASACHAALWLRHNFLPESHRLSQRIKTVDGSYWHGIMHRREGDFGNAKYWFGRVDDHPVFAALASSVSAAIDERTPARARTFAGHAEWNSAAFVDLCGSAVSGDAGLRTFCEDIQQREWELLFVHCFAAAVEK